MALNVQFIKLHNHLTDEDIIVPRLVNQQSLDFNALCEYLADGSTVTAADVAAVMKQIENRLPLVLGLNAKVVCSPEGLTFRPKVSGSITQSQLKAKLLAKLNADPTAEIDVNRALATSDLSINDLNAEIAIEMPKVWNERFHSKASFKRVTKASNSNDGENSLTPDPSSQSEGGENGSSSTPVLTIIKTGTGSSIVTIGGNAVTSGAEVTAGTEVIISVTPAGQTPTATLNGSSVTLTESDGTYTGTFSMPSANATLAINSGSSSAPDDN